MSYEWEHEEWRNALDENTSCYRHDFRRAVGGGGVCICCGDYIGEDEL